MSKTISTISDDFYNILLRYFEGDIINIDKSIVKQLKKNMFQKQPIPEVDKSIISKLNKIIKLKEKNPEQYASIRWIYPEWDEKTKKIKMNEYFEDLDLEISEDEDEDEKMMKMMKMKKSFHLIVLVKDRMDQLSLMMNLGNIDLIKKYQK